MKLPMQITFRHMDPSPALEQKIRELGQRLERFHSRIMRCQVIVESPHRHHRQGRLFEVHIHVTVPTGEYVARQEHRHRQSHEDVHVALRDAFDAMKRQLEGHEHARRRVSPPPSEERSLATPAA